MDFQFTEMDTPIGRLRLVCGEGILTAIHLHAEQSVPDQTWSRDEYPFSEAVRQLNAYFAGDLNAFDLRLDPKGTVFQRLVWDELRQLPFGVTISYSELAHRVDRPTAARAIGAANRQNPIPIVIPCHRVIGANGKLVGYSGGMDIKRKLLAMESGLPAYPSN